MIFRTCTLGVFQTNCYIIGDEITKEGLIVDPAADPDGILKLCSEAGINKIKYIVLTHGHSDHIGAVHKIKEITNAEILINEKDNYLIEGAALEIIPILRNTKLFKADRFISEGDKITLGGLTFEVIETPGHTPGSISILCEDILLSGDTLFQGSVGRTDLNGGSHEELIKAVKEKLFLLPDKTMVFPGHAGSTTIGNEKNYNPFFRD